MRHYERAIKSVNRKGGCAQLIEAMVAVYHRDHHTYPPLEKVKAVKDLALHLPLSATKQYILEYWEYSRGDDLLPRTLGSTSKPPYGIPLADIRSWCDYLIEIGGMRER